MEEAKVKIDEAQKKMEECEKKAAEYLAGWQRARADFLNHKKEEMERVAGLLGYAQEELILKFLPILDNFDIAEKNLPDKLKNDENVKGLLMVKKQILDFLKSQGLEEIEIGESAKFDPNFMEAVEKEEPASAPASAEASADKEATADGQGNIEIFQKGYKINGHLLRPAKVKIAK